ncbi:uncharacterized protein LOC135107510 [Scylla paramamosain]|uniref:uncharacterized protein LOC135107510 n=1 Tax=Scylla paramamosain TaxID=85552 RepID=UPI0030830F14
MGVRAEVGEKGGSVPTHHLALLAPLPATPMALRGSTPPAAQLASPGNLRGGRGGCAPAGPSSGPAGSGSKGSQCNTADLKILTRTDCHLAMSNRSPSALHLPPSSCHPHLPAVCCSDVVHWHSVAPPELLGDTPVCDVVQPAMPCPPVQLWHQVQTAALHSLRRLLCQLLAPNEPV